MPGLILNKGETNRAAGVVCKIMQKNGGVYAHIQIICICIFSPPRGKRAPPYVPAQSEWGEGTWARVVRAHPGGTFAIIYQKYSAKQVASLLQVYCVKMWNVCMCSPAGGSGEKKHRAGWNNNNARSLACSLPAPGGCEVHTHRHRRRRRTPAQHFYSAKSSAIIFIRSRVAPQSALGHFQCAIMAACSRPPRQ